MIPAPAIIPRSMSFIEAMPSSSTRQHSSSALSVKRSTRAALSIAAAVLIEPLPGLGSQVALCNQLLHSGVNDKALAVGIGKVLRHMQHGVQAKQVGEEERTHRRRLGLR